ncbi:MAG: 4-hydroxy-tetrahydrodipicolinate synthase [Bacteroidales bacterium]
MKNKFTGTGVALITPFKSDFSVDFASLKQLVDIIIDGGVEYLVALGTTSESATLDDSEKKEVVKAILEANAARVPVVVGIGGNSTQTVVNQINNQDFTGIAGLLSVVPYYNKPQQAGMIAHFEAVANASPVPVILYNVPGRTAVNMKTETTISLAAHPNIVAVKEASGDFMQIMQIFREKEVDFEVLSGDDALTLPLIAAGASGVISVTANAFPFEFSEMVRLARNNEFDKARELHYKLMKITELFFADGSPAGVKALLSLKGLCSEIVRLPLVNVNENIRNQIRDEYNRIK